MITSVGLPWTCTTDVEAVAAVGSVFCVDLKVEGSSISVVRNLKGLKWNSGGMVLLATKRSRNARWKPMS
jgi:hypothetical protein